MYRQENFFEFLIIIHYEQETYQSVHVALHHVCAVVIVLMLVGVVCMVPYPYGAGETMLQHLLLKTDL